MEAVLCFHIVKSKIHGEPNGVLYGWFTKLVCRPSANEAFTHSYMDPNLRCHATRAEG